MRFRGLVYAVTDGDGVRVCGLDIRLAGIDAPEYDQPYGRQAKAALRSMTMWRRVEIETRGTDRYGRTIARVWTGGLDVNREMVARGYAWNEPRYRPHYRKEERAARADRIGLWSGNRPTPPWEYRRRPALARRVVILILACLRRGLTWLLWRR